MYPYLSCMSKLTDSIRCSRNEECLLTCSNRLVNRHLARWLSCLHCLHCCLTARRSWVRFPHGALLALGGRSSPECAVLRGVISRAFLCGVCMFSPCSQGVSSTKNPNSKNMQNNRTLFVGP